MTADTLRMASVLFGVLASAAACGQTVYKWVDGQGVTHYSEQRPAVKANVLVLGPGKSDEPAAAATVQSASNANQSLDAAAVQFRKQACATAQENLRLLSGKRTVLASGTVSDPAGIETATKLSNEQRDAAKATARKNVETYCSRG